MPADVVRIAVVAAALLVLVMTPLFVTFSSGTSFDPIGAVIDAVAILAIVVAIAGWRRRRPA
ncbi:MAG TPA: hypothetical protein VFM93_10540 [Candidatus Limnocylindria bacterium]|nr:hypothetical protein [Candidatus Limnocylindria bacterium]